METSDSQTLMKPSHESNAVSCLTLSEKQSKPRAPTVELTTGCVQPSRTSGTHPGALCMLRGAPSSLACRVPESLLLAPAHAKTCDRPARPAQARTPKPWFPLMHTPTPSSPFEFFVFYAIKASLDSKVKRDLLAGC